MTIVSFHPPSLSLWTVLSLSLASIITTTEAATTVVIERTAAVSSRNKDVDANSTSPPAPSCAYAGELVISQPLSVEQADKFYYFGSQLLLSGHMTIDKINKWPNCGVSLVDDDNNDREEGTATKKNYSLRLKTYGDESSTTKTAEIGREIVADNETDFVLSGYTSKLGGALTPIPQEHRKICLTATSSKTEVHADKDYVFGVMPSSRRYVENALLGTKAAGAKTVAVAAQDDVHVCSGAPQMAQKLNMTLLEGQVLTAPQVLDDRNVFEGLARNMSVLNPDVMIMCIRDGVGDWNRAMRELDWTPKAQIYFLVFGTKEYEQELGTDAAYTMGVTSWDSRVLPPIPDGATQWTPAEFNTAYEGMAFRPTVYQIASQSTAISILAQAINRAGRLSNLTEQVKDELASGSFSTVYGNISFDENGQSTAPFMLLQYDANLKLHVLQPTHLVSTDFEMVYPMPTWANRDCNVLSPCAATNGTCTVDGTCDCPAPLLSAAGGRGATAECLPPPTEEETGERVQTLIAITVPVVLVIAMLVGAALLAYHHKKQQENNAMWLVKKEELIFADPPEVIGHGTFGLVLLAEYRGTQVAVKRVLPANKDAITTTASSTGKNQQTEQLTASLDSSSDDQQGSGGGRQHHNGLSYTDGKSTWGGFGSGLVSTIAGTSSSRKGGTASGRLWGTSGGSRSRKSSSSMTDSKKHRQKLRDDFIAEMRCVSKLRHPCITTIMGAVLTKMDEPMLIMEYMDRGSLYGILHNETMLLEGEVILSLLRDISQGCRFLHAAQPQVIHGDLRAGNILVDAKFRAKVADFGLSQTSGDRARGTPFWMAPELLRGESTNTAESDVYAFGITLYEVFSRKDPYHEDEEKSVKDVLRQVMDREANKRPPVPRNCPPQMAALMSDCIVGDPQERPTFSEIDQRLLRAQHGDAAETAGLLGTGTRSTCCSPGSSGGGDNGNKVTVSLFDIFPKHIAEALLDGKQVEPEHRDCVSIFFCDIVGFTNISSELEPRKVADMLDRLYQKFDRLSQEHDIFKVETIGDAYMAVTNLVKDQSRDHAKRIAKFASAAIREANNTLINKDDPELGCINIRVGIHSGPVVADVVGTRNPRYCLFGDSVNVASRMESNSNPNRIHCSENYAALLLKQFPEVPLKCRGTIEVKGKGEMKTYWVDDGSCFVNEGGPGGGGEGTAASKALPMIREEQDAAAVAAAAAAPMQTIALTEQSDCSSSAESTTENSDQYTTDDDGVVLDHLEAQDGAPLAEQHPGGVTTVGLEARSKMRGIEATIRERFGHDTCSTTSSSNSTVNC